ncbi:MAG: hypothetical protein ACXU97_02115, partial [Thermodesulfobacteriota bacterium]
MIGFLIEGFFMNKFISIYYGCFNELFGAVVSHIPVKVILNDKTVLPDAASRAAHLVYEQLKALQTHQGTEAKGVQ